MRMYIAGKITGDKNYEKKFSEAAKTVEKVLNTEVINPACLKLPPSCSWEDCMGVTLELLNLSDGIVLLPDWKSSPGTCIEAGYAMALNKVILHFEHLVPQQTAEPPSSPAPPETKPVKKERICRRCGKQITGRGNKTLCDECKASEEEQPE